MIKTLYTVNTFHRHWCDHNYVFNRKQNLVVHIDMFLFLLSDMRIKEWFIGDL